VTVQLADKVAATIDGQAGRSGELCYGTAKPTLVAAGTVSFFVIKRSDKVGLRVKDSAAARRREFVGLDDFPVDASWRIEAQWAAFNEPRQVPITNMLGQTAPVPVPGKAVFTRDGHTYELLPIDEGPGEPLLFVTSDATSGEETVCGGAVSSPPTVRGTAKSCSISTGREIRRARLRPLRRAPCRRRRTGFRCASRRVRRTITGRIEEEKLRDESWGCAGRKRMQS